jgi:antitoxin component YwqK of YwqJK toxin-antitoxin module
VVRRKVSDDPPREIAEHFYADGTRSIRAESAADQLDGLFQTWYPDGRPKFEGRFVDGTRAGTWKFWSQDGTVREVDYPTTPARVAPPAAPAP